MAAFVFATFPLSDENARDSSRLPGPVIGLISGGIIALSEITMAAVINVASWALTREFGARVDPYNPVIYGLNMLLAIAVMGIVGVIVGTYLSLVEGVNLDRLFPHQWWRHGSSAVAFAAGVALFAASVGIFAVGEHKAQHLNGTLIGVVTGVTTLCTTYALLFGVARVNKQGRKRRGDVQLFIRDVTLQFNRVKKHVFAYALILILC